MYAIKVLSFWNSMNELKNNIIKCKNDTRQCFFEQNSRRLNHSETCFCGIYSVKQELLANNTRDG